MLHLYLYLPPALTHTHAHTNTYTNLHKSAQPLSLPSFFFLGDTYTFYRTTDLSQLVEDGPSVSTGNLVSAFQAARCRGPRLSKLLAICLLYIPWLSYTESKFEEDNDDCSFIG